MKSKRDSTEPNPARKSGGNARNTDKEANAAMSAAFKTLLWQCQVWHLTVPSGALYRSN